MAAVQCNNIEIVRILLARDDLDIAATDSVDRYGGGYTALHFAYMRGYAEYVELLGKDRRMNSKIINIKDSAGKTALMMAVERNDLSCVERMAELDGVDWETENKKEESLEDVARWVFGNYDNQKY
jgi:ankyrin repeat protein